VERPLSVDAFAGQFVFGKAGRNCPANLHWLPLIDQFRYVQGCVRVHISGLWFRAVHYDNRRLVR